MAQLISLFGAPGSPGMPNVPSFQFWAMRGQTGALPSQAALPAFGTTVLGNGLPIYFVICGANTAHFMVGALVTLQIAASTIVVFEFTETVAAPGNIAVVITNGDTAAQCATALKNAINSWALANMPFAVAAIIATGFGFATDTVEIVTTEGSVPLIVTTGGAPILATTNNNGKPYGDALLHRAWRVFVYSGVDPALVSVFPVGEDVAIPFWPLHPLNRKAWPQQLTDPFANAKPEPR
jgi:hypothetical protein